MILWISKNFNRFMNFKDSLKKKNDPNTLSFARVLIEYHKIFFKWQIFLIEYHKTFFKDFF